MANNKLAKSDSASRNLQQEQEISALKTADDVKRFINKTGANRYDPNTILHKVRRELQQSKSLEKSYKNATLESNLHKAFTLFEFDKGALGVTAISEQYRTLFIDISRSLQKEYQSQTPSEKSLCHLAALSYIRILEAQRRLNNVLESDRIDAPVTNFVSIMSKEIDRATRHYFTALQTLQIMRQPALNVNIKTQTAVVGQNQFVQSNNK